MNLQPHLVLQKKMTSELELKDWMKVVCNHLGHSALLLLSGDLGAGKTTSVRYLCEAYGLQGVQSPTYAIHQSYGDSAIRIDHFDLYRLQNEDELVSTGFWDLLQRQDSLVLIEWFERIADMSWIEFEAQKRKIFGLKVTVLEQSRQFEFFQLK